MKNDYRECRGQLYEVTYQPKNTDMDWVYCVN